MKELVIGLFSVTLSNNIVFFTLSRTEHSPNPLLYPCMVWLNLVFLILNIYLLFQISKNPPLK